MTLVFAAIAPHGFHVIPQLSEDAGGAMATRSALTELGRRAKDAGVEAVILAGPHGMRVDGTICIADVARGAGTMIVDDRQVEMNLPLDGPLTAAVAEAARKHGVPIAMAGYAGNRRDQSAIPLDWGAMVPLWFFGHDQHLPGKGHVLAAPPAHDPGPPAVLATPSRSLPRTAMVEFGRALAEAAEADSRRVAFIASCDWGHTHRDDGPYGYDPKAKEVDEKVLAAIRDNDLIRLIDLDDDDVRRAAIDGLWQTLMLAGAEEIVPMRSELLAYDVPSYFGMIVAAFTPAGWAASPHGAA